VLAANVDRTWPGVMEVEGIDIARGDFG